MSAVDFVDHLRRQLGYLERSCASYDAGHQDEAIRIATIIRVLVHDTASSVSVLKHLGATEIDLLSTTFEPSMNTFFFVGLGMTRLGAQGGYLPQLGDGPINEFIPIGKWWSQVTMVIDRRRITRKDIVLTAANKDGGAHVDAKLTAEYSALARDGAVGAFIYGPEGSEVTTPIQGAHLVSLRQLGYELLHSPDLINLRRSV